MFRMTLLVLAVVLVFGCGGESEVERFDAALKDELNPDPTESEIRQACSAMQGVRWNFTTLASNRNVTKDGQDRIVDIAAVIENARWDYITGGNRSQLSWDRYNNREEWQYYCSKKR